MYCNQQCLNEQQVKVQSYFEQGDQLWNNPQKQNEGLQLQVKGLKELKQLMTNTNSEDKRSELNELYQERFANMKQKLKLLESLKGLNHMANRNLNLKQSTFQSHKEKHNVKWTDIVGLNDSKSILQDAMLHFQKWKGRGILLYGHSGTGKTLLSKACASNGECTFFNVSPADLISKFVGESERLIKNLFVMAQQQYPSIIFIDDIDSLFNIQDERAKAIILEFLVQMQNIRDTNQSVLVMSATNQPQILNPAIRRRFEKRIYIPLPDTNARKIMFKDLNLTENQQEQLSLKTEGYSGNDIKILISEAMNYNEEPNKSSLNLLKAFEKLKIQKKSDQEYDQWNSEFGDSNLKLQ